MATIQQHIFPPKPKKIITPLHKEKAATTPLSPKHGPEADCDQGSDTTSNALLKPKAKKKPDAGSV